MKANVPLDPAIPEEDRAPLPEVSQPQVVPDPDDLPGSMVGVALMDPT